MSAAGDVVRFIRTWGTTGAVAPSGRALARRMVAHVDPTAPEPVLELGPGTGVVTRALLEIGVPAERIVAVEYNSEFCNILGDRFPGLRVVQGDAYKLGATLSSIHEGQFSSAVSSLPLLMRPPTERRALILDVMARLAQGGALAQFSYSPKPPVPASHDFELEGGGWVVMNMPPAKVWTYRPVAG